MDDIPSFFGDQVELCFKREMLNLDSNRLPKGSDNINVMSDNPLDQFLASLPPPPLGKEWVKVRIGSLKQSQVVNDTDRRRFVWKLVQTPALNWKDKLDALNNNGIDSKISFDAEEGVPPSSASSSSIISNTFAEHVVNSQDSLTGISLKYNVPASIIKKANNMFSSNNVQAFKILRIPLCETDRAKRTVNKNVQDPRDIILQQFRGNKLSF